MSRVVLVQWNKQALIDWLAAEASQMGYSDLETRLGLSYGRMDWWRTGLASQLSDMEIQAIARYREWTEDSVRQWLGLPSAVEA